MPRDFKRAPLILPSISHIVDPTSAPEGHPPTRWDAMRQVFKRIWSNEGLEAFDLMGDADLPSIAHLVTVARDESGQTWDQAAAARYVARLVFVDQVLRHPDVPELFRRLAIELGLMTAIEACRAAGGAWDYKNVDHWSEHISDEVGRFLRGLDLDLAWLRGTVHSFFRVWTLEQAEGVRVIFPWLPHLANRPASVAAQRPNYHFDPRKGESDDEMVARIYEEVDIYTQPFRSKSPARGGRPLEAQRVERLARWSYEVRVPPKKSYRQIAREEGWRPDRWREVKSGVRAVERFLE